MTPDANGLEPEQMSKRELTAENARLRDVIARARREARSWPSRRVDHFAEGVDVILAESCVEAAPGELFDEVTRLRDALAAIVEAYDARTRGVIGTPLFAAIEAAREALR